MSNDGAKTKWSTGEEAHPADPTKYDPNKQVFDTESQDYQLQGGIEQQADPNPPEEDHSLWERFFGAAPFVDNRDTYYIRKAHCETCSHAIIKKWVCGKCLCPITNKISIKNESCPIGKWGPEGS